MSESPHTKHRAFALGAVVFPAVDSLLADLKIDVAGRGTDCLGLVVEERTSKSRVYFPRLDMSAWLSHNEIKEVAEESQWTSLSETALAAHPAWRGHFWIAALSPIEILETQHGLLSELWAPEDGSLDEYKITDPAIRVFKLSLGVEELDMTQWKSLEASHGSDLALVRFLPAGMHKLEVQLYLRD